MGLCDVAEKEEGRKRAFCVPETNTSWLRGGVLACKGDTGGAPHLLPRRGRRECATKDTTRFTKGCVNSVESFERSNKTWAKGHGQCRKRSRRSFTVSPASPARFSVAEAAEGRANNCPSMWGADDLHTPRSASGSAVTPAPFQPPIRFRIHLDRSSPVLGTGHREGDHVHPLPQELAVCWADKPETQSTVAPQHWLSGSGAPSGRCQQPGAWWHHALKQT